jgi:hypothetical protein
MEPYIGYSLMKPAHSLQACTKYLLNMEGIHANQPTPTRSNLQLEDFDNFVSKIKERLSAMRSLYSGEERMMINFFSKILTVSFLKSRKGAKCNEEIVSSVREDFLSS